jgi:hypothetical protein
MRFGHLVGLHDGEDPPHTGRGRYNEPPAVDVCRDNQADVRRRCDHEHNGAVPSPRRLPNSVDVASPVARRLHVMPRARYNSNHSALRFRAAAAAAAATALQAPSTQK